MNMICFQVKGTKIKLIMISQCVKLVLMNNHHFMVMFLMWGRNLYMKCYLQNKVTEKFKRPFKKRHSSVYHQPSNRVNKYLAQAIDARSVDREKSTHVNLATLCFKDHEKETQVGDLYSFSVHAYTGKVNHCVW
jgi:hypothetical protein